MGTCWWSPFCLKYIFFHLRQSASESMFLLWQRSRRENVPFPGNSVYLVLKYYPRVWKAHASISVLISKQSSKSVWHLLVTLP